MVEDEGIRHRVADRLRRELASAKMTQTDLARLLKVKQPTLSRKLSGDAPFTVDQLDQVCTALDLNLRDVLDPKITT